MNDDVRDQRDREDRLDAFEAAWRRGEQPRFEKLARTTDEQFAMAVIELEIRLQIGDDLRVEDLFHRSAELLTDPVAAAELIWRERELRRDFQLQTSDDWPDRFRRYPEMLAVLGRIASEVAAGLPQIPGAEQLEFIGQGGMGTVYRAWQPRLTRWVAIKVLRSEFAPESPEGQQFLAEARITGQLNHAGIPVIHDILTHPADGRPYIVMELITGPTLADVIASGADRHTVSQFEALAAAVAHAHTCGIIHRDLKPQNVIVLGPGAVKVMDWGLAKELTTGELANPDRMVGTLPFMPPEQAMGHPGDERSDVFGLGAILFALLTGEPPLAGHDLATLARNAIACDTTHARQRLATMANQDLAALCGECLSADPALRPANAGVVATRVARLREAAEDRAEAATKEVVRARARFVAIRNWCIVGIAFFIVAAYAAFTLFSHSRIAVVERQTAYILAIRNADDALIGERIDKVLNILARTQPEPQRWEARYLNNRCGTADALIGHHPGSVMGLAVTADGTRAFSAGKDGTFCEWNLSARAAAGPPFAFFPSKQLNQIAFSADGEYAAAVLGDLARLEVWKIRPRQRVFSTPTDHPGAGCLALSADGRRVALGETHHTTLPNDMVGRVTVWDTATGSRLATYTGHDRDPMGADRKPSRGICNLAFSADATRVASATRFRWHVWEVATGQMQRHGSGSLRTSQSELYGISALAFEETSIMTGGVVDLRINDPAELLRHDLTKEATPQVLLSNFSTYQSFSRSADGRTFACGNGTHHATVYDSARGTQRRRIPLPMSMGESQMMLVPDGRQLLTGNHRGEIHLWNVNAVPGQEVIRRADSGRIFGFGVLDNGKKILFTSGGRVEDAPFELCLWDRETQAVEVWPTPPGSGAAMDIAVDGDVVAVAYWHGVVQLWDWRQRKLLQVLRPPPEGPPGRFSRVTFTPSGSLIVTAQHQAILIWDDPQRQPVGRALYKFEHALSASMLSPDGTTLAINAAEFGVTLIDVATGTTRDLAPKPVAVSALAYRPDGLELAVATGPTGALQLWNLPANSVTHASEDPHNREIAFLVYTPDSQRLFSGARDGVVKVWQVDRGTELLTLRGHTAAVNRIVFHKDWLFTSSWDGTVRLWDGSSKSTH